MPEMEEQRPTPTNLGESLYHRFKELGGYLMQQRWLMSLSRPHLIALGDYIAAGAYTGMTGRQINLVLIETLRRLEA